MQPIWAVFTYQIHSQTWPFSWTRQFTSCNHKTRCDKRWNYSERDFSTLLIGNMTRLSQWKDCTEQHISFQTKTIIMACQIWSRTYHLWTSLVKWKKCQKCLLQQPAALLGAFRAHFVRASTLAPSFAGKDGNARYDDKAKVRYWKSRHGLSLSTIK